MQARMRLVVWEIERHVGRMIPASSFGATAVQNSVSRYDPIVMHPLCCDGFWFLRHSRWQSWPLGPNAVSKEGTGNGVLFWLLLLFRQMDILLCLYNVHPIRRRGPGSEYRWKSPQSFEVVLTTSMCFSELVGYSLGVIDVPPAVHEYSSEKRVARWDSAPSLY